VKLLRTLNYVTVIVSWIIIIIIIIIKIISELKSYYKFTLSGF